MVCYILDDQYGKKIYEGMLKNIDAVFPIQQNILNPLEYVDEIVKVNPDYILLDNYFPNRGSGREEALGNEFLGLIANSGITSKIICISDYGKRLIDEYEYRGTAYKNGLVKKFISSKDPKEIAQAMY